MLKIDVLDSYRGDASPVNAPQIEQRIAIVDLADDLQVRKQRIFKLLKRLDIHTTGQRDPNRGNQYVAMVSLRVATIIRSEIGRPLEATGTATQPGYEDPTAAG